MIKLPKEINKMIQVIEDAGYEAYVAGGSIRDSLLGKEPTDWDIATSAPASALVTLFTEAAVISERFSVIKVSLGEIEAQVATFRIDGSYSDHRRPDEVTLTDKVEEDITRRDFTINAMMGHPQRGILDPFKGKDDLKARLVKTVGDPRVRFEEDPYRILRGIRFAAQLDFDLEIETFQAMQEKAPLLENISVDRIREEFIKIVTSKNSGKGLSLCMAIGALPYILGEECLKDATKAEKADFTELLENIDKAKPDKEYRLALVYLCFQLEKSLGAIERLHYERTLEEKLQTAVWHMEDLSFINQRIDLKQFVYKVGYEMYDYLENLSKQQRKVYDFNEYKIRNRMTIFDNIRACKEAIFLEDLAVNGNDLMELGLEGEEIGRMLAMLLDVVHKTPRCNNKEFLLKKAKEFKSNPVSALLRKVRWFK